MPLMGLSSTPSRTTNTFASSRVVLPPERVLKIFEACAEPAFKRMLGATYESRTLAGLRDTLLPKLISGELRVRDAERLVEREGDVTPLLALGHEPSQAGLD